MENKNTEQRKRNIAYKIKIGDIEKSEKVINDGKLACVRIGEKNISRVNIIANVIEKFVNEEKKYAFIKIDDASGQILLKSFESDPVDISKISQGDSVQVVGLLREYNGEIYISPEILKSIDPKWLLVRKIEFQNMKRGMPLPKDASLRDIIIEKIKAKDKDGGIEKEHLILDIDASPESVNEEIKKLLEHGTIYEPRPGVLRYLN